MRPILTLLLSAIAIAAPAEAARLTYLGQQTFVTGYIPAGPAASINGTIVSLGGLSGIDYDASTGDYVVISDDRSQFGPARYYRFDLEIDSGGFTAATATSVTALEQPDGSVYPLNYIDPESIRVSGDGTLIYVSEGDGNPSRLQTPFVREMNADGSFVRDFAVDEARYAPTNPSTTGIRNNLAFESLAISGDTVFVATENALAQDGPAATLGAGTASRILAFNKATGAAIAEYVYAADAIAEAPIAGGFATAGLVEFIALSDTRFIAVERSFSVGAPGTGYTVKLYDVSIAGATDVLGVNSLVGQSYTAASKTLLFDLADLNIPLDNIEGIALGPRLANGERTLVLVSDNNFNATQFTQFLAFSVAGIPEPQTWAMMVAGFGFIGFALRRRRLLPA